MRALLLAVLSFAVAHAQDDTRTRAEAPVRQVVQSALPAGAARGGDLSAVLEKLPPEQRAAALRRLAEKEGDFGGDPAVQGTLGAAYLSLGDANRALGAAERALKANPSNPDALAVKAQVLASRGDKQGAQALLGRIPPDHPRRAAVVSAVQLSREGSRGASPSSIHGSAAGPSSMGPGMLRMLEHSLTRRGESRTLDAVIKKVDPSARSLRDLQGHGVQFDLGQPDQKDAVELVDRGGQKTLLFHPSVLQGRDNHATAQVGRALEEFVADRDYEGVSAWLRKMGGRVTGMRVYLELAPGDRETKSANTSEQAVLNDRGAVQSVAAPAGAMSYPNMEGL
ncbi:MAG: tetratricopeptide repeat protein [Elusimicrobia bacterium]|nr:tetratricopeptide repeat protein [Elusimicrobiota bacterium]